MKVTQVSNEDGRLCAQLVNALNVGRWDINGKDAEELVKVKAWVRGLAGLMAEELKSKPKAEIPSESIRVKSVGKLPPIKASKKSKK